MNALIARVIEFQGNGVYDGLGKFNEQYGAIRAQLREDLDRLNAKGIPVDVVFEQTGGKR